MSSTAHFPDPDHFQSQSDQFLHWLAGKQGVQINPKIRLADLRSQAAGRGVVAQADIAEGEELFTIPRDLILSTQNSQLKDRLPQNLEELGPWLSLMLVMIYEFLLGERSAWAPYFKVLPRKFDTLMFWSTSELQELQGSSILDKIGKEGAEKSILQTIAPIVRANPFLFPPIDGVSSYDGDAGTQVLLNLAHVMGSLIMAYAFDIEKPEEEEEEDDGEGGYMTDDEDLLPKAMVPLADLLNANADQNNARLFQEEGALVMKAIKPISPGAEIFNDYGEIPRADLLRRYGYVTDNYAGYDVVELPLELICEAAGLANADAEEQPPLELLEYLELLDDGYIVPRLSPNDSIDNIVSDELALLLRTLTLPADQLEQYKSKSKPPKPAFGPAEGAIFQKTIQLKQSQYGTTIAQDEELLAQLAHSGAPGLSEESARRGRMAIQVRLGEKQILQDLFTLISNFLASSSQNGGGSAQKRAANGDNDESRMSKALKS
ncbi:SET domain protein [Aspergillus steynii IBT 23096]|uniref:SET domain protein n=1 Tax=Aspergillus steynii IBT 23096 TaxID=1392250 RepID=A0A2I2G9E2_9EURO|nr:SET domain protein [Aspergillus steynii IBT 23096]PLB49463.1 SET domain protein [Aspergillus steynii IBT 23096]